MCCQRILKYAAIYWYGKKWRENYRVFIFYFGEHPRERHWNERNENGVNKYIFAQFLTEEYKIIIKKNNIRRRFSLFNYKLQHLDVRKLARNYLMRFRLQWRKQKVRKSMRNRSFAQWKSVKIRPLSLQLVCFIISKGVGIEIVTIFLIFVIQFFFVL